MNTPTPRQIRRTILRVLAESAPYALPEKQLFAEVNDQLRPAIDELTFQKNLSFLKDNQAIGLLADPLDEDARKWHIREAGRAMLQE